jgi:hypothetical protein
MLDGMFGEHACSWPRGEIMKRIYENMQKKISNTTIKKHKSKLYNINVW